MRDVSRRTFVQLGAAATAATAVAQPTRTDANSTLRAAVLGVNGRGKTHISAFEKLPGVEVAVLCDPDSVVLGRRAEQFSKRYGRPVDTETDLRKVFDRQDIDVVGVATPNHWHTLATIWACQAGKDVYVEKPGTHNVYEGRRMIEAAQKYGRIVQHGVQLRSNPELQRAVELLREGVIGDVYLARGLVFRRRPSIGKKPDGPAPKTLDWDLWQGPAAEREFSSRLVHYNWHWHWDYGNGDVANQGVHETDMCLWGLGPGAANAAGGSKDLGMGLPSEVSAMGGKFLWDDDKETPELLSSSFLYPEQKKMIEFSVRFWDTNDEAGVGVGNIFYGSEGYLTVKGYERFDTYLGPKGKKGPSGQSDDMVGRHFANFIDAVRSRDASRLNAPPVTAHTSSSLAHLGNIAYRLGRRLAFDPQTETFPADAEANALLTRAYREPYVVPQVV
ncbi:MAG: Gfo/Idh/MocA family oxidoreductase [Planctomycetota bacterium]